MVVASWKKLDRLQLLLSYMKTHCNSSTDIKDGIGDCILPWYTKLMHRQAELSSFSLTFSDGLIF
jgi:hypothetical protein